MSSTESVYDQLHRLAFEFHAVLLLVHFWIAFYLNPLVRKNGGGSDFVDRINRSGHQLFRND